MDKNNSEQLQNIINGILSDYAFTCGVEPFVGNVVIADDNISKIYSLINISKRTKRIVLQNIIFAGFTKLTFLLLGAIGVTGMLLAVFADVGVTLLAILNSLRVLTYKEKKMHD